MTAKIKSSTPQKTSYENQQPLSPLRSPQSSIKIKKIAGDFLDIKDPADEAAINALIASGCKNITVRNRKYTASIVTLSGIDEEGNATSGSTTLVQKSTLSPTSLKPKAEIGLAVKTRSQTASDHSNEKTPPPKNNSLKRTCEKVYESACKLIRK